MYIRRTGLVLGVLFFTGMSAYTQDSGTPVTKLRQNIQRQSADFEPVTTSRQNIQQQSAYFGPVITLRQDTQQQSADFEYDYYVDDSELRLVETVIPNAQKRNREFRKRMAKLHNCSNPTRLFYKGKAAGKSHLCSRDNSRVLLYSYGDKIYEVSSETEATINIFTKHVLPLACQLHGNKECVSMFY